MDKEVVKKGRKKKVRIEEIGNCWKKMEWDEREMQERKKVVIMMLEIILDGGS